MPGLLVVDDTALVRSTITNIVTRQKPGLSPVYEATNGEEAVKLARSACPDIVLMDIKMPGLDGLQAAALIRSENPATKIIMLTAYDEFVYVQEALKMGAVDYLLKPVRPAKLIDALAKIQTRIESEQAEKRKTTETQKRLNETLPLLEASLVEHLIYKLSAAPSNIQTTLTHLGKTLSWPAVMVVDVDDFKSLSRQIAPEAVQYLCDIVTQTVTRALPELSRSLIWQSRPGRVVVIVSTDQKLLTSKQLITLAKSICRQVQEKTGYTVTISIGRQYADLDSIPISYAEARLTKRHQAVQTGNTVVHIDNLDLFESVENLAYPLQVERNLLDAVLLNQREAAEMLMNDLVDHVLLQSNKPLHAICNTFVEIFALISRTIIEAGSPGPLVMGITQRQFSVLGAMSDTEQIRPWALNSLVELMTTGGAAKQNKDAIQLAIDYIQQNYVQPDIALRDVANAVNLSPSHLAYLLKEKLGVSYIHFLTTLRIQRARTLLRTSDITVSAIAEAVGYPNASNFYRLFLREVGVTPGAYRERK